MVKGSTFESNPIFHKGKIQKNLLLRGFRMQMNINFLSRLHRFIPNFGYQRTFKCIIFFTWFHNFCNLKL